MPPIEDMENPKDKFASEIYSSDMEVIGRFYQSKSNRVYVHYDEISPYLVNALIATEDIRFKDHSGIDVKALFRAFIKRGLLFQKSAGEEVRLPNSWLNSFILLMPIMWWNGCSRSRRNGL